MSPVGQGTKHVLAAQVYLSLSLVVFARVIIFLLLLKIIPSHILWSKPHCQVGELHCAEDGLPEPDQAVLIETS